MNGNKSNEYSQDEIKEFYNHEMNNDEKEKLRSILSDEELSSIETSTYKIKYIKDIGFMAIGNGYLIMDDGRETPHYFAKIYEDGEEFLNILNNK